SNNSGSLLIPLSKHIEKLMAEYCIIFTLTLSLANVSKIKLRFSSAINEKSLGDSDSSAWLVFEIKQGIDNGVALASMQVPAASGSKKGFTYNGIFLFCKGLIVFGCITDAP